MAEFREIETGLVDAAPERLRAVSEDIAEALASSIAQRGLINPITVRGPGAEGRYVLVCGAHRLRAHRLLGRETIPAMVVEADGFDAILMEIAENAVRNELSKLDRAMHIVRWREVFEQKYGPVKRGGDQSANIALWSEASGFAGWTVYAQEKIGLSKRSIMYAQEIALKIRPELRAALSGTPEADNQRILLRFADNVPEEFQLRAAEMIRSGAPVREALRATGGDVEKNGGARAAKAIAAFSRLNRAERAEFASILRRALHAALADAEARDA
ncbi:MAG: chromosome partitioning protein ParB [Alphaproteobacteria bacterium HGW-Alphaproteobacteria-2]|nr:MAG: chromosome partitioning protein ParB [Alphaproteobacteria bacterium HGW-Alphaproteobacteria-2]